MHKLREAWYGALPPSVNAIYKPGFHGRINLSTEGRTYANRLRASLAGQWAELDGLDPSGAFAVGVCSYMHGLEYGGHKTRKAKSRWRKVDASNLYKLVADVVAEALGVDDSSSFDTMASKRSVDRKEDEFIHVVVFQLEERELTEEPKWVH